METIWIAPPALAVIGITLFVAALLVSRRFDRKHPHLSRKGMCEQDEREKAARTAALRSRIPIPPFHPEEWRMNAARDELASERLDRSLTRLGERVASDPKPPAVPRPSTRPWRAIGD